MKCFYHSGDLDGFASGAIVKYEKPECVVLGINYGQEFPFWMINADETVILVDFTLQPFELMEKLQQECGELIWIDHHSSAIEEADKHDFYPRGIQRVGIGACALTWEFFRGDPMPDAIKLLAEYDVWNHSDPRTLPFQYGFRFFENTYPDNQEFWEPFLSGDRNVDDIVQIGATLLTYEDRQNKKYADTYAFETSFGGLTAICVNKGMTNSKIFDSVYDPGKHDIMITFCRMKPPAYQWTVSLYSIKEDVDCGQLASKFGGGGHKGAAGFQCEMLPFAY